MRPDSEPPRARLALNRDSAAKLGAGLLLAIALATSLPALMRSEQPEPLEPDVGLPQAPIPDLAPAPPPVDPAVAVRKAKKERRAARRAATARKAADRRRAQRRHRRRAPATPAPATAAPTIPVPVAAPPAPALPPSPTHEDFGFEGP